MEQKKAVGDHAATLVKDKMTIGLGTGSTARYMIEAVAKRVKDENLDLTCVATSTETQELAAELGLNVKTLAEVDTIDLTIDGADEISSAYQGIKGGGGALLYEKIVASNSKKNVWIADNSKIVEILGAFPLPVEVVTFGSEHLFKRFKDMGFRPEFRKNDRGSNFKTDADNLIIDLHLEEIKDPKRLAHELNNEVGVVEHGLFIDIVDQVIVGDVEGNVEVLNAD